MRPVIEPRTLLRIYAWTIGLSGVVLVTSGASWFPMLDATLIRILGAVLMGAGLASAGLSRVADVQSQRAATAWFAAAHVPILLALWTQSEALRGAGMGDQAARVGLVVTFLLFYSWFSVRRQSGPSTEWLRSQYELQIRSAVIHEERNRLARDLHDSIKQQLFVIQTSAATVQARFFTDPAGAAHAVEQVREAARQALTEMQAMLDQLRAAPLEVSGLVASLQRQCEALQFRIGASVQLHVGNLPANESLPPGSAEALLRVAQEALANVGRHARAQNVRVRLDSAPGGLELRITDDGQGFDTNEPRSGMGLANIRERARQLGAVYELMSRPGGGTTIQFVIPVSRAVPRSDLRTQAINAAALLAFGLFALSQTRSVGVAGVTLLAAIQTFQLVSALRKAGREAVTT